MRIGSLFSGYGGLDMGAQAVLGGEVVWHVEYDAAPSKILKHHWPDVPNYGDVTTIDWASVPPIDALTAGYPCQPFSIAGKRKGSHDERHLWPYVLDAIRFLRPRIVILENVRGHLTLGFDRVLGDLAEVRYDTRWICLPASAAGAPHRRERIFIVAQDAHRPVGDQWWVAAPGQEESGRARTNVGGRGGTSASDTRGDEPERWGIGRDLGSPPHSDEGASGQRERLRYSPVDRSAVTPNTDSPGRAGVGRVEPIERDIDRRGSANQLWGKFEPAIRRWENTLGRLAPAATVPSGRDGAHRLNPVFVEWMMGLPEGHVTAPEIGLSRAEQLKALGNGVVPQQAALALSYLLEGL